MTTGSYKSASDSPSDTGSDGDEDAADRHPGPDDTIELPIDGSLDLHAFRPSDVAELVHDYLDACRERGILSVRIIHGKGVGTLRRIVHAQLDRRDDVVAYRLAGDGSSWGATLVELLPPA